MLKLCDYEQLQVEARAFYILYGVCTQTSLDLCDPKTSCPLHIMSLLILDNWVYVDPLYRRWIVLHNGIYISEYIPAGACEV